MNVIRYHIKVSGRVQGVGYRYFCERRALSSELTGWVRNQIDGSVELEVQGETKKVERFCEELERGPVLARVTRVEKNICPVVADESNFEIRY